MAQVVAIALLLRSESSDISDISERPFPKVRQIARNILVVYVTLTLACMAPPQALRLSAFNVTSILTDTGFATADFSTWGSFAVGLFFILYLVGGCAGSTAGGDQGLSLATSVCRDGQGFAADPLPERHCAGAAPRHIRSRRSDKQCAKLFLSVHRHFAVLISPGDGDGARFPLGHLFRGTRHG
nr:potassium transporter TrkG [Ensifer aridi]